MKYLPSGYVNREYGWLVQTSVPQEVLDAQVEEALALMIGISARTTLQRDGVKSFRLGNLNESYGSVNAGRLASYEAQQLLAAYITACVPIV